MYSTRLDSKECRYLPTCILNRTGIIVLDTFFDTGAKYTCYSAKDLDDTLCEADFKNNPCILLGGFVDKSKYLKFYKYFVKQFIVGNIDLGQQSIWITFDDRITDNVVGMDIIKQITCLQQAGTNTLHLFKDVNELMLYVNGVISRKCYSLPNGSYYVIIDNAYCYFDYNKICRDQGGYYIMLRNQKCYLK